MGGGCQGSFTESHTVDSLCQPESCLSTRAITVMSSDVHIVSSLICVSYQVYAVYVCSKVEGSRTTTTKYYNCFGAVDDFKQNDCDRSRP